jgi:hypothetical protein
MSHAVVRSSLANLTTAKNPRPFLTGGSQHNTIDPTASDCTTTADLLHQKGAMPTIRNVPGPYRLFFYSFDCNEPKHVHVQRERMVCKFWLEPVVLSFNEGFSPVELNRIRKLIVEHRPRILEAWNEHRGE